MKNKKRYLILSLLACTVIQLQAQVYNEMDEFGNITQHDENGFFNPNKRDSTKNNKQIPRGVWAWTVDRNSEISARQNWTPCLTFTRTASTIPVCSGNTTP